MSNAQPKPRAGAAQSGPSTPIARLSAELLRLIEIDKLIDRTSGDTRPDDDAADANMLPDGRKRYSFLERVREEALARRDILEQAITLEEPENLEDVLTLAVLHSAAVDALADLVDFGDCDDAQLAAIVRAANGPRNLRREHAEFAAQKRTVDRLQNAIVRGLGKLTSSPLVDEDHYWSLTWDAPSWEEELTLAEAEVAKLKAGGHV
jgi:hypothetical protein